MIAAEIDERLVALLRSPISGSPLVADGDWLVGDDGDRYPISEGIPVLLQPDPRQEAPIVRSFRDRAPTYFRDNYGTGGNPGRRARADLIRALLNNHASATDLVLEAGAGPAVLASDIVAITPNYVGLDLSLENLVEGVARVGPIMCVCADMADMPFRDGAFDVVTAIGCLEYVADMQASIRELTRVAKPGGMLVMSFANERSPARKWDETIVHPIARFRGRRRGRPVYTRTMTSVPQIERLVEVSNGTLVETHFLNQGLLGYPFSSTRWVRQVWTALTSRLRTTVTLSSEIVVVVRNGPPEKRG